MKTAEIASKRCSNFWRMVIFPTLMYNLFMLPANSEPRVFLLQALFDYVCFIMRSVSLLKFFLLTISKTFIISNGNIKIWMRFSDLRSHFDYYMFKMLVIKTFGFFSKILSWKYKNTLLKVTFKNIHFWKILCLKSAFDIMEKSIMLQINNCELL